MLQKKKEVWGQLSVWSSVWPNPALHYSVYIKQNSRCKTPWAGVTASPAPGAEAQAPRGLISCQEAGEGWQICQRGAPTSAQKLSLCLLRSVTRDL